MLKAGRRWIRQLTMSLKPLGGQEVVALFRAPGAVGVVSNSGDLTPGLIAGMIHFHPGAMKVRLRCLGIDRVVLIAYAMIGAGMSDGTHDLVRHTAIVRNGHAVLADETFAASI